MNLRETDTAQADAIARHVGRLADAPDARGPALFAAGVDAGCVALESMAGDAALCRHLRQLPPDRMLRLIAERVRQACVWPS